MVERRSPKPHVVSSNLTAPANHLLNTSYIFSYFPFNLILWNYSVGTALFFVRHEQSEPFM